MSIQAIAEVWDQAPRELTPAQALLLMALANGAGEHRMVWYSISTLAQMSFQSERSVYNGLKRLKELSIIEDVPEEEWPREAHLYESVVRRLRPPGDWATVEGGAKFAPPTGVTTSAEGATASDRGGAKFAPKPRALKSSKEPSVLAARRRRAAMDRHPSTRAQAAARAAADDDLDPDKVLGIVPDKVENNGGRKKGPGPDSAMRLALDFRNALALDPGVWGPDPVNVRALAGSFSRWKREGVTTSDVSRAIMLYASVPGLRNPALPPWRDFLSQRNNLLDKVRRLAPAVPLDTESWTAAPDRTDADTEPWI